MKAARPCWELIFVCSCCHAELSLIVSAVGPTQMMNYLRLSPERRIKCVKIRKAVIPAAGLGTWVLLPLKVMLKEMLPIVDKPAIQYIVEEAVAADEQILIITGRGSESWKTTERCPNWKQR